MTITQLNNLSGKAWTKLSKSVWASQNIINTLRYKPIEDHSMFSETSLMLSQSNKNRDPLKKQHPATFVEEDIIKLIDVFSQEGQTVCDPFLGSGSSAIAALTEKRHFKGIELYKKWLELAEERIRPYLKKELTCELYQGNALNILKTWANESVDFIITSPPYWNILKDKGEKAKKRQLELLETDYGNHEDDLGQIEQYSDFLILLQQHFKEYYRILKPKKYVAIVISDFRKKQDYYLFHADIAEHLKQAGFLLQGLIILIQDHKKLFPYGYPTTFVPNIVNQFVVIGRKII